MRLHNPIIKGMLSIKNGAPGDVDTLLAVAPQTPFWMLAQNLFPVGKDNVFPFNVPPADRAAPAVNAYVESAFYVTGARLRDASPGKNLTEPYATARMDWSGHWTRTRARQP